MPVTVALRPSATAVEGMWLPETPTMGRPPPAPRDASARHVSPDRDTLVMRTVTRTRRHSSTALGARRSTTGLAVVRPRTEGAASAASWRPPYHVPTSPDARTRVPTVGAGAPSGSRSSIAPLPSWMVTRRPSPSMRPLGAVTVPWTVTLCPSRAEPMRTVGDGPALAPGRPVAVGRGVGAPPGRPVGVAAAMTRSPPSRGHRRYPSPAPDADSR